MKSLVYFTRHSHACYMYIWELVITAYLVNDIILWRWLVTSAGNSSHQDCMQYNATYWQIYFHNAPSSFCTLSFVRGTGGGWVWAGLILLLHVHTTWKFKRFILEVFVSNLTDLGNWKKSRQGYNPTNTSEPSPPITLLRWTITQQSTEVIIQDSIWNT